MKVLNEIKTGRGRFGYESQRTKGGRLYIPSTITKHESFDFVNGSTVKITLCEDGIIILERVRNNRIEPLIFSENQP